MLWLNTTTGEEIQSPKRPSPAWVSIVEVEIGGMKVDSTLDGLTTAITGSTKNPVPFGDFDTVGKTGLDVFANERYWKGELEKAGFPYITTKIASDGTLEIRYDENAKDDLYSSDLVIPKDKDVLVRLGARDVLHSFYLPHFRVKMDCVPGVPTHFNFKPRYTTNEMRDKLKNQEFNFE